MGQSSVDVLVADWTIQEIPLQTETSQARAEPEGDGRPSPCAPASLIALWSYDRLTQHDAEQDAARLGLAFQPCERPEELTGCALAILHLDHLQPWGEIESVYQAALKA